MRRPMSLLLIAQVLAITAVAQGHQSTMQTVEPASCPDGLHALGLTQPPRSTQIRVHYDSLRDSSIATYARYETSMILRPRDGVNMVSGIMHFARRPPAELPHLELDLLVHSPAPRSADERLLAFQLDDSIHLSLGLAGAYPTASIGGLGVNEHIISMLSPSDGLALLRAGKIRGSLGSTAFEVSDQDRDGLRELAMYVRCGAP